MGFGKHELPNKGKTDTWYTPKWITDDLGEFDLDPCSNSTAPYQHAKVYIQHDLGECGLERESGQVGYS